MLKIKFHKNAEKFLKKQNKINPSLAKEVTKKILLLSRDPNLSGTKVLKGYQGYRRARVGDYRILYSTKDNILYVILIGIRGDIYQIFRGLKK